MKKIITLLTVILINFSCYGIQNNDELNDELSQLQNSFKSDFMKSNASYLAKVYMQRMIYQIEQTHLKITNFDNKKNTTGSIFWSMNKKRITKQLNNVMTTYEGETPDTTSSNFKKGITTRNNLYFYEKPLGVNNGLTFELPKNEGDSRLKFEVFSNFKAFISIKNKKFEKLIPIFTSTNLPGCGENPFSKTPKIFCAQTSAPNNGEPSIGHKHGFSNEFTIPYSIKNTDEITLSYSFYYKDIKL